MLSDFYKTEEWQKLIRILRLERVNDEGNIICEYCGKPIVKKYDCIAHHNIQLTDENYTDPEIAYNPDNIKLVHHKCHNIIHDRLGFYGKKVYLVHGSPLSGKTTWVMDNMSRGDLVVDVDRLWNAVSCMGMFDKPDRLKSVVFEMRDMLLDNIRVRNGKYKCAYIIGGYPLCAERRRLIQRLGAEEIHIDTDKEECLRRLHGQADRDIKLWGKYIDDYWERYSE
jgi:hypothetical protein